MPLTYQPFAAVPEVVQLGKELSQNVGEGERLLSIAGATALYLLGHRRSGWKSLALYAGSAALFSRGVTGRCPLYYRTNISTKAHAARPEQGDPQPDDDRIHPSGV